MLILVNKNYGILHQCSVGLVHVLSVAAECLKDGTDLVRHQDITVTAIVC